MKATTARRRKAKGRWMQIRDHELLVRYMEDRGMSQARLGRYAETSRQFIHQLTTGEKRTCTPQVADRIEEALGLLKGTLFVPHESPTKGQSTPTGGRSKAAA
ncbi:helix-turn-helix transcriptional regulator [Micrococcus sp.]|uniref:helix-turn-helix transcriptional regulator n=1 Tax=Micrococcus sp. TaxID=1271 RepID=UPI002A90AD1B|nr:helix-turn-helix transcriptional regulator [Micrococcus sp.]MDY6054376.1 helix-turn-helix transcriptional regulator [Micrococcus sp.]